MDMSKIPTDREQCFPLLDFLATVESESESSVSLFLGLNTNRPNGWSSEFENLFASGGLGEFFQQIGWIDLHYPCKGNRKALIRINAPTEYHNYDRISELVAALFDLFAIPSDTIFVANYFLVEHSYGILPRDEFGRG